MLIKASYHRLLSSRGLSFLNGAKVERSVVGEESAWWGGSRCLDDGYGEPESPQASER